MTNSYDYRPQNLPHASLGEAASGSVAGTNIEDAREELRTVQAALTSLGYHVSGSDDPAHGLDGSWGGLTRNAVLQFQRDYGLPCTGELDDETADMIVSAAADARAMASTSIAPDELPVSADAALLGDEQIAISDQLGEPTDDPLVDIQPSRA